MQQCITELLLLLLNAREGVPCVLCVPATLITQLQVTSSSNQNAS